MLMPARWRGRTLGSDVPVRFFGLGMNVLGVVDKKGFSHAADVYRAANMHDQVQLRRLEGQ